MQGLGNYLRTGILGAVLYCASNAQAAFALPPIEQPEIFRGIHSPTYLWEPTSGASPKAIILGVHGGVLHGRSYEALASELANDGVMFASLDLRGFGKWRFENFGSKEDAKFRYKRSMQDIESMLVRLKHYYPSVPIICLGESLGSHIAFKMASENPTLVDGVIAVSPFSNLKAFLSPRMLVNAVQVAVNPKGKLNLKPYLEHRLSNKPDEVKTQFADPNNRNKQSIGELFQSLRLTLSAKNFAFKLPVSMPVLIVVGDKDNLAGYKGTVKKFHKMKGIDKQLIVLKGSGHLIMEASNPELRAVHVVQDFVDNVSSGRIAQLKDSSSTIASTEPDHATANGAKPSSVKLARGKQSANEETLQ
ncbi:MAG: lysophospholipase [Candidatus Obscuribacterales bacterium]|jgi:alpha-beta hydrolase superfamily lysophospholipase|nr:lysophospholipase [Candidatus Obscuribacterales bacterium]